MKLADRGLVDILQERCPEPFRCSLAVSCCWTSSLLLKVFQVKDRACQIEIPKWERRNIAVQGGAAEKVSLESVRDAVLASGVEGESLGSHDPVVGGGSSFGVSASSLPTPTRKFMGENKATGKLLQTPGKPGFVEYITVLEEVSGKQQRVLHFVGTGKCGRRANARGREVRQHGGEVPSSEHFTR